MSGLTRICILLLLIMPFSVVGQGSGTAPFARDSLKPFNSRPTIGLGIGMFSYYGDVSSVNNRHPLVSRIGYQLNVEKNLTQYLALNFHAIFGQLGGNERTTERNLNFQSEIRTGGISLVYNFHQLMPTVRRTEPWVSVGVESFEFLSKTDLYDSQGNFYHYWSDGSIMNLPEDHPDAPNARYLQRDYVYESDIRSLNADGFGKYPERSFAIPVGAGIRFVLSPHVKLKVGTTMHFTFTDMVDGVSEKSLGQRKGDDGNDRFLMTSASMTYDFKVRKKAKKTPQLPDEFYDNIDFAALEAEDTDKDGVRDFDDLCAGTPPGVVVDLLGCPLDADADGVPDYLDEEPGTPSGAIVNNKGVQLTDSVIALMYDMYTDSTGKYARIINRTTDQSDLSLPGSGGVKRNYMVQIGRYSGGIPAEMINKFLSVPDIRTRNESETVTLYLAGSFNDWREANNRKNQLANQGITGVIVEERNGRVIPANMPPSETVANKPVASSPTSNTSTAPGSRTRNPGSATEKPVVTRPQPGSTKPPAAGISTAISDPANTVVFRVQLAAYKNRLSANVLGAENLVEIHDSNGLYKYLSGSFTDYREAARHKVDMLVKGYSGAFVVAYKNGQRITLAEAGATLAQPNNDPDEEPPVQQQKPDVEFRLQIGAFRSTPPADVQQKLAGLNGVQKEATQSGLTRYTVGSFSTYEEAASYKQSLAANHGFADAFIVSYFQGQIIPVQEALELLK